ncbi:MAG: hypothetical protein AAF449_11760 [Myxococcota bacterium]
MVVSFRALRRLVLSQLREEDRPGMALQWAIQDALREPRVPWLIRPIVGVRWLLVRSASNVPDLVPIDAGEPHGWATDGRYQLRNERSRVLASEIDNAGFCRYVWPKDIGLRPLLFGGTWSAERSIHATVVDEYTDWLVVSLWSNLAMIYAWAVDRRKPLGAEYARFSKDGYRGSQNPIFATYAFAHPFVAPGSAVFSVLEGRKRVDD